MVADFYGNKAGLGELRRRFPVSMRGAKLGHLIRIAQEIGLNARPLRLEVEHLDSLALPCILHWDFDHFVVLTKVGKSVLTIVDPALGEVRMATREASNRFTGVALELSPGNDFVVQKSAPKVSVRKLLGAIRGLRRSLALILLLSLSLQVFVVLAPFYMQWVVDHVLVSADLSLLTVLGIGFGLALILQTAIGVVRGWSVIYLSAQLGQQWMSNVFAHLVRLPMDYFEKRHLGDITSRMSSLRAIQQTLTTNFIEAIIDGLMALVTLTLMFLYSWKLAFITIAAVSTYLLLRWAAYRPLRDRTEKQLVAAADQQTHLLESLRGMQSLKVAGEEPRRRATYENLLAKTINHDVRLARMNIGFSTADQLVFGIERIAVIWIGAVLTIQGAFSVGMLIAYLAYKDQFARRTSALIDRWVEFRMLNLHSERLSDIVLAEPEFSGMGAQLPKSEGARIDLENVYFRYGESEPWVLNDCSLTIVPGESVAIVGPSGCGKTTLVKLMLGLLTPTSGVVRIGGYDLAKVGRKGVQEMVGAVMQDDRLFAGSIADNISFFDDVYDFARIERASKLAAIHDEICAMPMGYNSLIGDMGSSLSGGQRQRVVLARALYRNPSILFLDEATSHLDVGNERAVNEAVKGLSLTKVLVAHRPETIASADRVLTMNCGRMEGESQREASEKKCPVT